MTSYLLSKVICIPFIKRPFQNLPNPEMYGINNAVDFCINIEDSEEKMGAWFIRPVDGKMTTKERFDCDSALLSEESETVILYLHGNSDTRSQPHRVGLYKFLQRMNLPTLAFDYRGYADSSSLTTITDFSLTEDAVTAFTWLKKRVHPKSKIIVWGHSLGSGVSCKFGDHMAGRDDKPDGYILEAAFMSMLDEIQTFKIANVLQYAGLNIENLLANSNLQFDSGSNILGIKEPILMLHAKDDIIVPYESGERLFILACERGLNVKMLSYERNLKLGHNNIYKANGLSEHVSEFLNDINNAEKPAEGMSTDSSFSKCKQLSSNSTSVNTSDFVAESN